MDTCPHCGSEDYGPVNEGHARACLSCGYDDEHGTLGVCPGGPHPRDGQVCCDACWARAPLDLPDIPRWRSRRRSARPLARKGWNSAWHEMERIDAALVAWLRANPVEPAGKLTPGR